LKVWIHHLVKKVQKCTISNGKCTP
jgi:hypothetical protein